MKKDGKEFKVTYQTRDNDDFEDVRINGEKLETFLKDTVDQSLHETIRQNVLTATRNFNHRIKMFFKHIVKGKDNPMSVRFFNYRIEFQGRGAGHLHGVFWIDWDEFFSKNKLNVRNQDLLISAFKKLKNDQVLEEDELLEVADFADKFVCCSFNGSRSCQGEIVQSFR